MDEQRPPRRKRYSGKNPRKFSEKYKELNPERYAADVEKVLGSGKTPAGMHVPIMVDEVLQELLLEPGMRGVDATLGYGGHAQRILEKIAPGGQLIGLDVDPFELPKTEARIRAAGFSEDQFRAVKSNYAGIAKVLEGEPVDFVFADLGCSSMQIDNPGRGFTWKDDGPLDMRMNPDRGIPVSKWLEKISAEKLEMALVMNADEPQAVEIAEVLAGKSLGTTTELVEFLKSLPCVARLDEDRLGLTIRRVFQALRIAVNEEFTALESFLRVLPNCLKSGGRAVVLTFHSGEDRRVKKMFQVGERDGIYAAVSDGVVIATPEERRANPRSVPAKLRWAVKG